MKWEGCVKRSLDQGLGRSERVKQIKQIDKESKEKVSANAMRCQGVLGVSILVNYASF